MCFAIKGCKHHGFFLYWFSNNFSHFLARAASFQKTIFMIVFGANFYTSIHTVVQHIPANLDVHPHVLGLQSAPFFPKGFFGNHLCGSLLGSEGGPQVPLRKHEVKPFICHLPAR